NSLMGRVEDWRAGWGRSISTLPRFQPPPRRTQHADFPHCAPPFASRRGLLDLSCRGDFRSVASHSIAVEQPWSVVQPPPTPPFPAEAVAFLSMRQMVPEDPRNARTVQPSPCRISSASGPANQWTTLSSRPCLPLCWRRCKWQGPFAPRTLLRFIASTDPSATLSSSADFPVSPVIRPTLLRR